MTPPSAITANLVVPRLWRVADDEVHRPTSNHSMRGDHKQQGGLCIPPDELAQRRQPVDARQPGRAAGAACSGRSCPMRMLPATLHFARASALPMVCVGALRRTHRSVSDPKAQRTQW
jgi:hypothetical protein